MRFFHSLSVCFALVITLATLGPPDAWSQEVSTEDDLFRYTLRVDQLVYGLADDVEVSYAVENLTGVFQELPMCCCGFEFFAVRDSSCTTLDGLHCQIAGCDACEICVQDPCQDDPCSPIPFDPHEERVFEWVWDRQVCELDIGFDGQFGNIGGFRIIAGWHHCEVAGLSNVMNIPIFITTQVSVRPLTWSTLKTFYQSLAPDPQGDAP